MLPAQIRANPVFYLMLLVVLVGAINWLLVGAFGFDLVVLITGAKQPKTKYDTATRAVYIAVGAVAIALVGMIAAQKFT